VTALAAVPDVTYSEQALELAPGTTFERWVEIGSMLGRISRAMPWLIGDWIEYGESRYGEKYAQALDATGLDYSTLSNYAYVCRRIEPSRRREHLSFSVHAEVASLPPDEQDRWLDRAEQEGLRTRDVRASLQAIRGPEVHERFMVRLPAGVASAVRSRAQGRTLAQVAADLLTDYAKGRA
jgi:hypothetical protein